MDTRYIKALLLETKAEDETKESTYVFRITKEVEDRDGEVVTAEGWRMSDYLKNPVVLDSHNYSGIENILGRTVKLERQGDEWHAEIAFNQSAKGKLAKLLVDSGDLKAVSVGFQSHKMEYPEKPSDGPVKHVQQSLLEISMVPVPMLQDALRVRSLKAAIPPHNGTKAPEDESWDGDAEVRAAEGESQLKRMHAWVNPDGDPNVKANYKMPHHRATGEVVWAGVAAAMAALFGARGNPDIPDEDRRGVYNHLERHYSQFDKETPEFKSASELSALGMTEIKGLFWEGELDDMEKKAGRRNSKADETKMRRIMELMGEAMSEMESLMGDMMESADNEDEKDKKDADPPEPTFDIDIVALEKAIEGLVRKVS